MAKDKSVKAAKAAPVSTKSLNGVKSGRVSKPAEAPKAKSKDVAKKAAKTSEVVDKKKKSKKVVKEPTPDPSSDSDEEMTSASSASSDSESEAEAKPAAKVNGKANGVTKAAQSSSDESSEDDSESSDAPAVDSAVKPKAAKVNGTAKAAASSSESDSDESDEEEAKPKAAAPVTASDDESEDGTDESSEDDSDESEESDEEEAKPAATESKKRKAETEAEPASTKKGKVEISVTTQLNGKPLSDPSATLFVGWLSWNVDDDWLYREFESFGTVVRANVVTERDSGRSKGFGYVEFESVDQAAKALEAKQGAEVDNRQINIDFSQPRPDKSYNTERVQGRADKFGDRQQNAPSNTLFIANLPFGVTPDTITPYFQDYGSINGIRLPTDPETGAPKGFGYIEFNDVEEAKGALEALNGADIEGRNVRLDYAGARKENSGGGRGGFGSPRGGGRGGGFRGGRGGDRGGRGGRGGSRGRGSSTNRGGFGDFSGKKVTF